MTTLLQEIKAAQPDWFSAGNKRFFGDVKYYARRNKKGFPFLIRATYAFSDMFGQPKKLTYRVNKVDPITFEIGPLLETSYPTYEDAKDYIEFY